MNGVNTPASGYRLSRPLTRSTVCPFSSSAGAIGAGVVGRRALSARTLCVSLSAAQRGQIGLIHRFRSAPMASRNVGISRTAYADRPPWLRQLPAATER